MSAVAYFMKKDFLEFQYLAATAFTSNITAIFYIFFCFAEFSMWSESLLLKSNYYNLGTYGMKSWWVYSSIEPKQF